MDFVTIKVDIHDDVVIIIKNKPMVKQMSNEISKELTEAITAAKADDSIKAVVLTGTGKNVIVGADIIQLQKLKTRNNIYPHALQFKGASDIGLRVFIG